jgi:hypothetical protein
MGVEAVFHAFLTSEIIGGKASSSLADSFHIWVKSTWKPLRRRVGYTPVLMG